METQFSATGNLKIIVESSEVVYEVQMIKGHKTVIQFVEVLTAKNGNQVAVTNITGLGENAENRLADGDFYGFAANILSAKASELPFRFTVGQEIDRLTIVSRFGVTTPEAFKVYKDPDGANELVGDFTNIDQTEKGVALQTFPLLG